MSNNVVSWFEIPVTDMDRAKQFYETVFEFSITVHDLGNLVMGWFPSPKPNAYGTTGSLVLNEQYKPSATEGPLIYFNSTSGDIANELSRVVAAGGKILKEKTLISEDSGYMALILDSEGNRIALYSKS
jgi:predicted enzyme related to lactoylglutathione lyase